MPQTTPSGRLLRSDEQSGREFLKALRNRGEIMGMSERAPPGTNYDSRTKALEAARLGAFIPADHVSPLSQLEFETLSEVHTLRHLVIKQSQQMADLARMIEFLVASVPGPTPPTE
jgi:hypothetical protein